LFTSDGLRHCGRFGGRRLRRLLVRSRRCRGAFERRFRYGLLAGGLPRVLVLVAGGVEELDRSFG
jgi:hypothetical protein